MVRFIAYARFAASGVKYQGKGGIDEQIDACIEYALGRGQDLSFAFSDEKISGKSDPLERREFLRLLSELRPGDVVLVTRLDRLGADPRMAVRAIKAIRARSGVLVSLASQGDELTEWLIDTVEIMDAFRRRFADLEHVIKRARVEEAEPGPTNPVRGDVP